MLLLNKNSERVLIRPIKASIAFLIFVSYFFVRRFERPTGKVSIRATDHTGRWGTVKLDAPDTQIDAFL